jgi:thioesterase-3
MDKSSIEIKVRGYHLDVYQHVNNARFLEMLEEARWSHYDAYPPKMFIEEGWAFVVVNINIDYKSPAVLGDVLNIQTVLSRIGASSLTLRQEVSIKGTGVLAAGADVTFVIIDLKTKKVLPVEGQLLEVLTRKL